MNHQPRNNKLSILPTPDIILFMKEKVVFFGAGQYVLHLLETLTDNFDLVLIITTEKNPNSDVLKFAKNKQIKSLTVDKLTDEVLLEIKNTKARIGVLASFGLIIPDSFLNVFEFGIINIHPSLLPKYRGATPVQAAILNEDKKTGVSIMILDKELDHGPLLAQLECEIHKTDTSEHLYKRLFKLGADELTKVLPKYISGEITPETQNHQDATFTDRLTREAGYFELGKVNGNKIEFLTRAYYPWPGAWFKANLNNEKKIIKLLPEEKIQVEGKNVVSYKDFENGYPEGKDIISKIKNE